MKKIGDPLRNDFGSPGTISQKTGLKLQKHDAFYQSREGGNFQ